MKTHTANWTFHKSIDFHRCGKKCGIVETYSGKLVDIKKIKGTV